MTEARQWWGHLTGIVRDTGRVWWAVLPRLLMWVLLGNLILGGTLRLLVPLTQVNVWLVMVVFSAAIVGYLACQVVALRTIATATGSLALISDGKTGPTSWAQILGTTLLPFLGLWSSFGGMERRMNEFHALIYMAYGDVDASRFVGALNPNQKGQLWVLLGVVVGTNLLGRVLQRLRAATNLRALGLVAALVEGFYILIGLLVLFGLSVRFDTWFRSRRLAAWWEAWCEGLQRVIHVDLGFLVDDVLPFWNDVAWPALTAALVQPLLWMTIALLVCGWALIDSSDVLERRLGRAEHRPIANELQGFFLGSIDGRWMPMWNSIRLTLKSGLALLAAYVVVWALWSVASDWIRMGVLSSFGGHDAAWWETVRPLSSAVLELITEPVRLVLIGVVVHRAIVGFRSAQAPAVTP